MLLEDINEAGGVLGEKLRVIIYDDAGDANKARTFGTRLIEDDEVIAIIGGSTTGATMAIMPIAEEEEIPFISLAGAIEVIDPVRKYTFKNPHTDRMACEKIFEDMQKQGITKIGLISGSDSFGAWMRKPCLDIVGEYDIEVVGDEHFGPNDTERSPQLTKLNGNTCVQS